MKLAGCVMLNRVTDRTEVAAAFAGVRAVYDAKAWDQLADHFTSDCVFTNPFRTVRGREALREFASGWPDIDNVITWNALDGDRVVTRWTERPPGGSGRSSYTGMSTWVYGGDGLFRSYEAVFDTAAFHAAWSANEPE